MGYQNYLEGEWKVARQFLLKTRDMLGVREVIVRGQAQKESFIDGPSQSLLRFMERTCFVAPEWWSGMHELLEMADLYNGMSPRLSVSAGSSVRKKSGERQLS